jgi:predicted SAM-dependent methyltransferase
MKTSKALKYFIKLVFRKKRKINIGAGKTRFERDWFFCDIDVLDILVESQWDRILHFLKLDNLFAEHVWEHIPVEDILLANKNCFRVLKSGGVLRIAVPDGYHPDKSYIDFVKPGGKGQGADDHKQLFTYKILKESLEKVGFKTDLLEYWDENGEFHFKDWSDEAGKVMRSKRYDWRNTDNKLNYTSIIIDAIKP